jgi:hypothetical protein
VRTYEVVLKVGSYRYLGVDVVGVDSFLGGDLWEPGAKGAGFMLKWNPWDDVSDCGYPDMRGPTALSLCGEGEGTANVSEGTIAGVLVGSAYLGEGPRGRRAKTRSTDSSFDEEAEQASIVTGRGPTVAACKSRRVHPRIVTSGSRVQMAPRMDRSYLRATSGSPRAARRKALANPATLQLSGGTEVRAFIAIDSSETTEQSLMRRTRVGVAVSPHGAELLRRVRKRSHGPQL